ncbi:MAG: hypothetical protein F6K54_01070 [Okeania sp. SIO3B5]|nr:hypothetical protein [Okeania sp. SIO3B5]NEO51801.1 hypothetical protein [Okeania sp. SIO3B5]
MLEAEGRRQEAEATAYFGQMRYRLNDENHVAWASCLRLGILPASGCTS